MVNPTAKRIPSLAAKRRRHFVATLLVGTLLYNPQAWADTGQGQGLYNTHCASCHGATLNGSAHGPALRGETFLATWQDRHHLELLRYNKSNMPPGGNRLTDQQHFAIVTHLLQGN